MTTRSHGQKGTRRGQTVVEVAIVANILFMLLFGVFEYGRIAMIRQLMDEAAREGARMAVVSTNTYPATTTAQLQTYVTGFLVNQSLNNLNIQIYQADPATGANLGAWNTAPFGSVIAVQIDGDYPPTIPTTFGILPNPLHLMAKSIMRSEAN